MNQLPRGPRLASAGLYALNCFIVSVAVVAIFALVARPPASNALEQVAYPLGVSLYIALPVALVALVISITVLEPLRKRGTSAFTRVVLVSITGAVATTTIALAFALLQGKPGDVIWILIVVPWSGAFFGGGVLVSLLHGRIPSLKYFLPGGAVILALLGAVSLAFAASS